MLVDARALFWWRWLLVASMTLTLFGLALLALPRTMQTFFNLLMFGTTWQPPAFGIEAAGYIGFVFSILGAVLTGWGVLLLYAIYWPFRQGRREGWQMIALSIAACFVPAMTLSLGNGLWQNAALSLLVAAMFAIPLAATWKTFHKPSG